MLSLTFLNEILTNVPRKCCLYLGSHSFKVTVFILTYTLLTNMALYSSVKNLQVYVCVYVCVCACVKFIQIF